MRSTVLVTLAVALAMTLVTPVHAEDEGFIGVMVKKGTNGIEINGVIGDTPADKAGLKTGDLLTKMNGDDIDKLPLMEFIKRVAGTKPGDEIKFTVVRDGK